MKAFFSCLFLTCALTLSATDIKVYKSEADIKHWIDNTWYPAWVGGEPSVDRLLMPLFAPGGVYVDPNVPNGKTGDALREFFKVMLGNNPNWKFETQAIYPTASGFVLHWVGKVPVEDRVITLRGVDIFKFNDAGLIVHLEEFFDLSVFRKD